MGTFDDLPADQRAVLQMVLQRGRSYDEIATVLSIDRSAVRQRALDACALLAEDVAETGPEYALVTDYLLGQLPGQVAEQVYVYLEAAAPDRAWALALSDRLAGLTTKALPPLPVAVPLDSDVTDAAAHEQTATPVDSVPRASPPTPQRVAAPARPAPARAPRRPKPPSTSLWRNPLTLGVSAVVIVVVVVILLTSGGSSTPKPGPTHTHTGTTSTTPPVTTDTAPATTTTSTSTAASPQLLSALNLTSPVGATQTLGVAQVIREGGVVGIVIRAQGVPANSTRNAYGVWLYNSAASHEFVGFVPNLVGKSGVLSTEGKLPSNAADFKRLLITLETQQHPKTPGEVVLSGPFSETTAS